MNFIRTALKAGKPVLIDPVHLETNVKEKMATSLFEKFGDKTASMDGLLEMVFGKPSTYEVNEGVAYIPVHGYIGKGLTKMEKYMGACDMDEVLDWVQMAYSDPNVKAAIMDVDSPGGAVTGVEEVAHAYRALGMAKPTMSFCDGRACSGAYWISSQGNRFVATPSSEIGNVGAYVTIPDMTGALEKEGVKLQVFKSGKYKAIGHPGLSLTEDQKAFIQGDINAIHEDFKNTVKAVRSYAKDEDLEGQTYSGREAAKRNLVTGLAWTWHDAVSSIKV